MNLSDRSQRWEYNDFIVLVQYVLRGRLTLDNLVKWGVAQLIERDLRLLPMILWLELLAIFWLGPPFAHSEYRTSLAKLRKDQVRVFVEGLQFLRKSASQSK